MLHALTGLGFIYLFKYSLFETLWGYKIGNLTINKYAKYLRKIIKINNVVTENYVTWRN